METGEALLLGLGVGLGAWWLLSRSSSPAAAAAAAPPGSDLGPLGGVLALPGLKQVYNVLQPVHDKVLDPFVEELNKSPIVTVPNAALRWTGLGGTAPMATKNPDGTITRKTEDPGWYTENIGAPVSQAGTGIVNTIKGIFS
jgi:hypothetical protein